MKIRTNNTKNKTLVYFFLKSNKNKVLGNSKYCLDNFYNFNIFSSYTFVFYDINKINTNRDIITKRGSLNAKRLSKTNRYCYALVYNEYILNMFTYNSLF